MDIKTTIMALVLGFLGTVILGGLFNMPDAGAIVAISVVGGRIVGLITKKDYDSESQSPA